MPRSVVGASLVGAAAGLAVAVFVGLSTVVVRTGRERETVRVVDAREVAAYCEDRFGSSTVVTVEVSPFGWRCRVASDGSPDEEVVDPAALCRDRAGADAWEPVEQGAWRCLRR